MCVVSNVSTYGQQIGWPPLNPISPSPWTIDTIKKFMDLLEQARKFDEAAGQKDCVDPEKAKFEEALIKRLEAIEKKLNLQYGVTGTT